MLAGTQKPMLGTKLNRAHPLANGLVGCWLFNEGVGDMAYDSSGYGNHGTLKNMAFPPTAASGWNPGRSGSAIAFDGLTNHINCGNGDSFNITDAITIEAWVKMSSLSDSAGIFSSKDKYALLEQQYAIWTGSGVLGFGLHFFRTDGSNFSKVTMTPAPPLNEWIHIIAVSDTKLRWYLNGETRGETDLTITPQVDISSNRTIGRVSPKYFNGSIDGAKIYNRALSAEESKWSYREPYAMFERGELLL